MRRLPYFLRYRISRPAYVLYCTVLYSTATFVTTESAPAMLVVQYSMEMVVGLFEISTSPMFLSTPSDVNDE